MVSNNVRIISGKWKGRKLKVLNRPTLRPSLGRTRETLFNWLAGELADQPCLDLFAGTGALGFEAASRGASEVTLVERDRQAAQVLRDSAKALQADNAEVICSDALRFLSKTDARWQVVFLDPPFRSDLLTRTIPLLEPRLLPGAWVYWEAEAPPELPEWLLSRKSQRTGESHSGIAQFADH